MNKNRFKLLSIMLSYVFFIFVIIISINTVVPEKDLKVLEPNEILVKKVDNNFLRDKNSVYEILEKENIDIEKRLESQEGKSNIKIAEEACHIEIDRLQEPVGKQDQFISALGGIQEFYFNKDDSVEVNSSNLTPQEVLKIVLEIYKEKIKEV